MKDNWRIIELQFLGNFYKGTGIPRDSSDSGELPAVRYGELYTDYDTFISGETHSKISEEIAEGAFKLEYGDILLAGSGETPEDIGKSAVFLLNEGYAGGDIIVFRPDKTKVNPKFLALYFETELWKKQRRRAAQGQSIVHIHTTDLKKMIVELPDLETQQKIVQILDIWNEVVELLNERILNERNKLVAFQRKLFVNTNYEKIPLGHLSTMYSGGTPNSKIDDYYGGDISWVSIADMTLIDGLYLNETKKHLTKKGFESSSAIKIHPKGSVLYAMYASIGECAIAGKDMASSQAILGINCKEDKLYNKYLYYYLSSNKQRIKILGQQGAQSNLNAKIVKEFEIPLPPLRKQIEMSGGLDTQIDLIQYLVDIRGVYLVQYKYLLNHLISGDFDLTNIELENGKE